MTSENKIRNLIATNVVTNQVVINDFKINYVKAGSGPNLLLLHGANIGWGQWYPNIAEFAKYFTVYALDMPGAGRSTKVDFKKLNLQEHYVELVEEFIRLNSLENLSLVGHSIGGWVALKMALSQRQILRKMVLVNSLGLSKHVPFRYRFLSIRLFAELLAQTVMKPSRENMKNFLATGMHDPSSLDEEFVDYFYESIHTDGLSHPLMLIHRLSGLFEMHEELVLLGELDKIKIPVLVIVGDSDPLSPVAEHGKAADLIPTGRFVVFENSAHVPSMEKPAQFNKEVLEFLKA